MKYEIEIEGLPEGWEPVAYRHIRPDDEHVLIEGEIRAASNVNNLYEQLIVKKKQPRRIVLEETDEDNIKNDNSWCSQHFTRGLILTKQPKRWREVKETDLSLHNADDKESLRLSVDECAQILGYINDNNSVLLKLANFVSERK